MRDSFMDVLVVQANPNLTTRIQPCRDAYIGLQYGYFGGNTDQFTGGCIWNGAIGSCILLDVVLQYGGFAMHIKKLMQPRYGCKHRYYD